MSRWPIRLRLTAAFALAMLAVLGVAALLAYLAVRAELDDSLDASLAARADAVAATADRPLAAAGDVLEADEGFAQVISPAGRTLAAAGGARAPALGGAELARARAATVVRDAPVAGIEGTARVLARPASQAPSAPVVIVGQSLEDRDETLAGLVAAFAIGGPVAVALASLVGYLLAAAALRPVETMRRRATEVSLDSEETLPLPAAADEVRRLGETLNEMLARLRGAFERERRLVADASHELRTPLAVLKAELEAALAAGPRDAEVRAALAAALEECDQLAQLTEDLLVLARAGEGELELRTEAVPARALLEAARERFAARAREQGRAIAVEAPAGLAVRADPVRMRQALGNLVDNALRHGEGDIALAAARDGDAVALTVSDAGPGFAPEIAPTAFERFTRGDAARTRGGAGLGLAIVRAIARAHGGDAAPVTAGTAAVRLTLPSG